MELGFDSRPRASPAGCRWSPALQPRGRESYRRPRGLGGAAKKDDADGGIRELMPPVRAIDAGVLDGTPACAR